MTLPTMGGTSRKRAPMSPSSSATAKASTAQSAKAGSTLSIDQERCGGKIRNTTAMTARLCASTRKLRITTRAACKAWGIRWARIMATEAEKQVAPSEVMALMNPHSTSEMARKGR